jgi:5-methylcytosine-specific restriction enzyme subunit McrC
MDTNGSQQQPEIIRETLVMHKIYEDFVANFYRLNLIDWIVEPQKKMEWFDENENTYLPIMKPDIMFTNKTNGKVVILDTKFTANSLVSNQWGRKIFNQSHLYQIYTYLKTQEHISKNYRYASGILLYPTINNQPLSEIIILPGHEIKIETINLAKDWQQIELDLLNLIH